MGNDKVIMNKWFD